MTGVLTWRYLTEYARRPLNLVLLVVVPVIFVALSAGAIADFARLLGGEASLGQLEAATAGWAAAFLAGVAGFFHVTGSRDPDRRLAGAGSNTARVVTARVASSTVLAAVASSGALLALAVRTDLTDPGRAVGATIMFAVIYLAIGITVGSWARSEVNGSLLIIFIWMFDVFLGPAMGRTESLITRFFPSHFPTLVMLDAATTHAEPLGDLEPPGLDHRCCCHRRCLPPRHHPAHQQQPQPPCRRRVDPDVDRAALRLEGVPPQHRPLGAPRRPTPVLHHPLHRSHPDDPAPVELVENGHASVSILSMTDVHGAIMVAITVAFLAGLAGLFVVLGSAEGDRRLVLAGFKPRVLASRLGVITLAAILVSAVSLAVTAASFEPEVWVTFAAATLAVAITYTLIGVVIGPLVGRVGGLYLMFLLPFLDVGLAQNIMFDAAPPSWAVWMPAHGAVRVLIDGAFSPPSTRPVA